MPKPVTRLQRRAARNTAAHAAAATLARGEHEDAAAMRRSFRVGSDWSAPDAAYRGVVSRRAAAAGRTAGQSSRLH